MYVTKGHHAFFLRYLVWYSQEMNRWTSRLLWFYLYSSVWRAFWLVIFQAHDPETRQQNIATWVKIKSAAHRLHFYSPKPRSRRATLLRLYFGANGSRWKKDMGWCEAHNKDDPIPHSRTEYSMDSTPMLPSMSSTYFRIDWLVLPSYCPLRNHWQNFHSSPTPSTVISPLIFWSLIGSRSFIFCIIP